MTNIWVDVTYYSAYTFVNIVMSGVAIAANCYAMRWGSPKVRSVYAVVTVILVLHHITYWWLAITGDIEGWIKWSNPLISASWFIVYAWPALAGTQAYRWRIKKSLELDSKYNLSMDGDSYGN